MTGLPYDFKEINPMQDSPDIRDEEIEDIIVAIKKNTDRIVDKAKDDFEDYKRQLQRKNEELTKLLIDMRGDAK